MAFSTMSVLHRTPTVIQQSRSAGRPCQPSIRFVHPARLAARRQAPNPCRANNFRNSGFGPFLWGVAPNFAGKTIAQLLAEMEQGFNNERQRASGTSSNSSASADWTNADSGNGGQGQNYNQTRGPGHRRYKDAWQMMVGPLSLPVDIQEFEDKYTLLADIPGLKREDLKIQVNQTDRTLTISGERKRPAEQEDAAQRHPNGRFMKRQFERRFGEFSRKFNLADNADTDAISARVDKGVLTLTVGKLKKEEEEPQSDSVKDVQIDI